MKPTLTVLTLMFVAAFPVRGQTLAGVWKPVEVVIDSGADRGRHTDDVQPGLMIFTERYYAILLVQGFSPRPAFSATPTAEELSRAFRSFTANAGTYQRQDSTIVFAPTVAKHPAAMAGPRFVVRLQVKSDTLWLSKGPGAFAHQKAKWVRVE